MIYIFRKAEISDTDAIHALGVGIPEINYSHVVPFMTRDEVADEVGSDEAFMAVATTKDGTIVGFILVDYYDPGGERWANITSLAVAPEHRRRGVFAALFECWKAHARARGITYVCCYARAAHPIVDFLLKRNFSAGHDYTFIDQKFEDIT